MVLGQNDLNEMSEVWVVARETKTPSCPDIYR